MGPARESIVSGRPKSQAIGVSHLTHDELAVWIDDASIVSFLVRTVSLAVLEFVVEMLDPSHPGLPSRQASWEDHPLRRRPRASIFVRAGSRPGSVPEATHRSDRSHSPGCHHARAAAAGFPPVGATQRDTYRPLRRLVRHHARPHLRHLRGQPRPLRSRRAPPQPGRRSRWVLGGSRQYGSNEPRLQRWTGFEYHGVLWPCCASGAEQSRSNKALHSLSPFSSDSTRHTPSRSSPTVKGVRTSTSSHHRSGKRSLCPGSPTNPCSPSHKAFSRYARGSAPRPETLDSFSIGSYPRPGKALFAQPTQPWPAPSRGTPL